MPLKPEIYASITQPVLLIHGDKNGLFPIKHAEQLSSQLTGVKDGAILYSVKGGSSMLSIIPGNASITNKVVSNFWSRLPHHKSHISPPETPVEVRMSEALRTLARLTGRANKESIAKPLCSLSFSCLSPDVIKTQSELLEYYKKDCHRAFSPLTASGRPLRKFSERESEHWFSAGVEGLSIANSSFLHSNRGKHLEKKVSRSDFSTQHSSHDPTMETITIKGSVPRTLGKSFTPTHQNSHP
ncbi:hypothetical protein BYT27DRAFT_7195089 [Phlegmacium glaucopus]|nr:hypothetical protein BYT27DRAFT_7195089 [Phlegmacium glaucopus]